MSTAAYVRACSKQRTPVFLQRALSQNYSKGFGSPPLNVHHPRTTPRCCNAALCTNMHRYTCIARMQQSRRSPTLGRRAKCNSNNQSDPSENFVDPVNYSVGGETCRRLLLRRRTAPPAARGSRFCFCLLLVEVEVIDFPLHISAHKKSRRLRASFTMP